MRSIRRWRVCGWVRRKGRFREGGSETVSESLWDMEDVECEAESHCYHLCGRTNFVL